MSKPQVNCYYQHRYGGLYIVRDIAVSTVDQSKWVVYAHCYPFEYQVWIRPYDDWATEGKFRMLEPGEYDKFLREKDQVGFREEITKNKSDSKKDK